MARKKYRVATIVGITVVLLSIGLRFFGIMQVMGNSMYPTYKSGDCVFINKRLGSLLDIKKDDIIVFNDPVNNIQCIKRVVATKNDIVKSCNGELQVNDTIYYGCKYTMNEVISVKDGEFFVIGDNYQVSVDSRNIGVIEYKRIIGKLINL